jgi:hypothetical protein
LFLDFLKSAGPGKESTLSLIRNDFTIKIKKKKTNYKFFKNTDHDDIGMIATTSDVNSIGMDWNKSSFLFQVKKIFR